MFQVAEEDDNDEMETGIEENAMTKHHNPSVNQGNGKNNIEECLVSVMNIGLSCSTRSPGNRMGMNSTVNKLLGIRDAFLKSNSWKRRMMR
uniref:Uncharacterized protein n=1 Tax=Rhizophora mucronata TaxID=61149 RepID=A0A2P2PM84_RHIMU